MSDPSYFTDDTLNGISDDDEVWGPLLFLRPEQHRLFSRLRVTAISLLCGGAYGMLGNLPLSLLARMQGHAAPPLYLLPLVLAVLCFAGLEFTVAAAWNRRARQIVRRLDWKRASNASRAARERQADHS